ncbi:MAG: PIN domain-containing protein [Gammaproteobacteria bacterium]|nr:PIN domain-containing protein [Gammaproteobacteria bacterium]
MPLRLDRDDLVARTIEANLATICLDTCSILDLARDPARTNITPQEQASSLFLLSQAEQGNLLSVTSERVADEHSRNITQVQNETEAGVNAILNGTDQTDIAKLQHLSSIFGITSSDSEAIRSDYAAITSDMSKKWLIASNAIRESRQDSTRASSRVVNNLAPSHRAGDSYSDCVILECYLSFVEECRVGGLPQETRIVFVSSNVRDFTRFGVLHSDLALSFGSLGMSYAANMVDASRILFPT